MELKIKQEQYPRSIESVVYKTVSYRTGIFQAPFDYELGIENKIERLQDLQARILETLVKKNILNKEELLNILDISSNKHDQIELIVNE